MKPQPLGLSSVVLGLTVSLLWGGNVAAIKLGLDTLPPFWSAFWRFTGGTAAVALWAWFQGVSLKPERGEWRALIWLSLMFAAQISVLNVGVNMTSPAFAVVLLNSHPVFTNLFGHFVKTEDRLTGRRVLGLVIALSGIFFVAFGRPEGRLATHPWLGNPMMLLSASLLAARVIFTRRMVQTMHPLKPVTWQMALALPIFFLPAVTLEPMTLKPLTAPPVLAILYQGPVIAGFCFVAWTTLLKKHAAGTLSMFGFTVPFFGVAASAVLFGERVGAQLVLGVALVTAGIYIVARRPGARAVNKEVPAAEAKGAAR